MSPTREADIAQLQSHLEISPEAARLLWRAGFTTPQAVGEATPKLLALCLSALPGIDPAAMYDDIPTFRRMVLWGSIEGKTPVVTSLRSFSDEDLKALGITEIHRIDDLTGTQMKRQFLFTACLPNRSENARTPSPGVETS